MKPGRWEDNGCRYVKENFDWDVVIRKYKDFFEEILG